jgi:hypothetical protein
VVAVVVAVDMVVDYMVVAVVVAGMADWDIKGWVVEVVHYHLKLPLDKSYNYY